MRIRVSKRAIAVHMHSLGWTQAELARKAKLRPATVSALLSGATDMPQESTVSLLAEALGCDVHDLKAPEGKGEHDWQQVLLRDEYEAMLLDLWRQLPREARVSVLAAVQRLVSHPSADVAATLEEAEKRVSRPAPGEHRKAQ